MNTIRYYIAAALFDLAAIIFPIVEEDFVEYDLDED